MKSNEIDLDRIDSIMNPEKYDLYIFLNEKGIYTLIDYLCLEKLFEDFEYFFEKGKSMNFENTKLHESKIDRERKPFYSISLYCFLYEDPITLFFTPEKQVRARLKYYEKLEIIELREGKLDYIRFSDKAYELFKNYFSTLDL